MSKLRKISIIILTILTIGIIWIGANINPVKADGENIDAQTVLKKILLGTIDFCDNYRMPDNVNFVKELSGNGNEIFGFHDSSFEQLFNQSGQAEVLNLPNQGFLPNHYPDTISCYQLFSGKDDTSFKGLFSIFGKDSYSNEDNNDKSVLEKLGYTVTDLDDYNTTCYAIQIKIPKIQNGFIAPGDEYANYYSNALCFKTKDTNENNTPGSAVYESAIKINDENIIGELKNGETYACTKIGTSECAIKIEMEPSQISGYGTWQYTNNVQQIKNLTQDTFTQNSLSGINLSQTFPQYLYKNDECTGDNMDSVNLKCQIEYLAKVVNNPYTYINFGDEEGSSEAIVKVVEINYNSDKQYLKEATRSSNDTIKKYLTTDDTGIQTFDPNITGEDRLFLDFYYIQQVIDDDTNNIVIDGNQCYPSIPDDDYFYIYTQYNGVTEWCKLTGDYATNSEPMYRIISQGYINWLNGIPNITALGQQTTQRPQGIMASVNFESVLDDYKTLVINRNVPIAYIVGGNNNHSQNNNQTENPITDNPTCQSTSAAGALSWIVCPIMKTVSNATSGMYESVIAPALEIKSNEFFADEKNTKNAWELFRNIADIFFIVLFLIIIFSQLTGLGIDNYGIKKILPKLIVVAILVNLSFIICQILAELSNIVGSSIYSFFNSIANWDGTSFSITADVNGIPVNESLDIGQANNAVFIPVAIIASIFAVTTILANPAILLSLLVSLLGVFIAILFLFFLLSVRQALVVILVIISPLAIVAYALPNTKSWFNKWWKLLSGLLLIYPICGLLVGGGNFASKIILNLNDKSWGVIIAGVVVGVAPIFFIPSVLRSSFSAMGKLGGTLTGFGARMRKGATGGIRNTERYRTATKASEERRNRWVQMRRAGGRFDENGDFWERRGIGGLRNRYAKSWLGRATGADRRMAQARKAFRDMENERMQQKVELDVEPKPLVNRENLKTRMENELHEAQADNMVSVLPVNYTLALQRKESARDAQEYKAYTDQYQNKDRNELVTEYRQALAGNNKERAAASLSALIQQGGISEALIETSNANWSTMDSTVSKRIAQAMATTNVDALKSFSKYRQTGGGADFNSWYNGTISAAQAALDATAGAKDTTYAQHLIDNGNKAMSGFSKDEMDFLSKAGRADNIRLAMETSLGSNEGKNEFGAILKNVSLYSNDAKTKTIAEQTITQQLAQDNISVKSLDINAADIGTMRGELAESIKKGLADYAIALGASQTQANSVAISVMRTDLGQQISAAQSDPNIANKTSSTTKGILGMP